MQFRHVYVVGVTDFEFVASRAECEVHGWGAEKFRKNILWSCRGAGGSRRTGATKILFAKSPAVVGLLAFRSRA